VTVPRFERKVSAPIVVAALACLPLVGCAGSDASCLPPALELSRDAVSPGGQLLLTAPAGDCEPADPPDSYDLYFRAAGLEWLQASVDVAPDGSFQTTVDIPEDASPGTGRIVLIGSAYDDCPVNGEQGCVEYAVDLTVRS
jgi:hypothetical protein